MEGFQYRHGDRPLEGYTIQRAVGRGGFGEVYYAISDAGREVALKAISGYEQIEVRGVSQCMNLKSPHLVSIFDIRQSAQGKSFVIMEYVGGPSLKELLEQSPAGLGVQKTAFFLREIAKGLSFLHERGIVHRDLKPGNIFYEDGYVKIGDYGLSKAIGVSRHSGQTITVGTVHYMAPEVGMGKYDRSIDIYALGVVLYELLTGQVPFFGSSHGEILMKHLMSQPDLTGIEEPFATVIRKAMSKDPAERFQSVQEMVESVFGEEHVRNSVSCFSPDSLTMVAGRVAQRVSVGPASSRSDRQDTGPTCGAGSSGPAAGGYGTYKPPATDAGSDVWADVANRVEKWTDEVGERMGRWGERIARPWSGEAGGSAGTADSGAESRIEGNAGNDPLERRQRRWLAFIAAVVVGVGTGIASNLHNGFGYLAIPMVLLGGAGITLARRRVAQRLPDDSELLQRLAFGGTAGVLICLILPLYATLASDKRLGDIAFGTLAAVGAGLFLLDWRERTATARDERVDLGEAFVAGILGWVVCLFTEGSGLMAGGILAGISLAAQVAVPWDPIAAKRHAEKPKERRWFKGLSRTGAESTQAGEHAAAANELGSPPAPGIAPAVLPPVASRPVRSLRRLPGWIRAIFIGLFAVLLGTGILLLVAAGIGSFRSGDFAIMVSFGVGLLLCSLFFLFRALKQTFRSYWSGLVRPFLMLLCVQSALTSALFMGAAPRLYDEDILIGLGFIIFPTILLIVLAFVSDRSIAGAVGQLQPSMDPSWPPVAAVSMQDAFVALMLACGGFLGIGGLHRFYAGRYATGLLWLCTIGLFGFGTIFDIVMISMGLFRDRRGLPLRVWMGVERVPPATTGLAALPDWPVRSAESQPLGRPQATPAAPYGSEDRDCSNGKEDYGPAREDSRFERRPGIAAPIYAPARTNRWLAAPGGVLLLVALALGLAFALNLPELVAAGFPDPSLNADLTSAFGYSEWPDLTRRIMRFFAVCTGLAGPLIVLIARRKSGAAHTGRALLASLGLLLTMVWLKDACAAIDWFSVVSMFEEGQPGRGLEELMSGIHSAKATFAAFCFVGSSILLAWPEHRERLDLVNAERVAS